MPAVVVRGAFVLACAIALVTFLACGETRSPIGDECLRSDDCLSRVCAARTCVAAPALVVGASNPPDPEEPRIPTSEGGGGGTTDAGPSDAKVEGG
jgi:hypothetical protein